MPTPGDENCTISMIEVCAFKSFDIKLDELDYHEEVVIICRTKDRSLD